MNTKFRYLVLFICLLAAAVLFFSVKAEIKDGYSVDNGIKAYECEKSIVEEFKGKDREYRLDVLEGEISLFSLLEHTLKITSMKCRSINLLASIIYNSSVINIIGGVTIAKSIGYYKINSCTTPLEIFSNRDRCKL